MLTAAALQPTVHYPVTGQRTDRGVLPNDFQYPFPTNTHAPNAALPGFPTIH